MSTPQQNQPPVTAPELTEEPFPGLVREWFCNRQIVSYRLTSVSPAIIQRWTNLVIETLSMWNKERPYLALHDVSEPGVSLQYATLVRFDLMNIGITEVGREQIETLFNQHVHFHARVAIGFNLTVSGQVSQTVMDRLKLKHPSISYKTFFNRERSLGWLMDAITIKSDGASADATQEINLPNHGITSGV